MAALKIQEVDFIDLYIGDDFCEMLILEGARKRLIAVPKEFKKDVTELKRLCIEQLALGEREFALHIGERVFRVTTLHHISGDIFVLRQSKSSIRPFNEIGLNPNLSAILVSPKLEGLVLVSGEMGAGKTSTAASLLIERLRRFGGVAVSIEDPPETMLDGMHGHGRCLQLDASPKFGGYSAQMKAALRSGASMIFLGEVRDEVTACEVIRACVNGHFVVSTLHAGSPVQAIERLQTFVSGEMENASRILAEGLSVVLWQSLQTSQVAPAPGQTPRRRLEVRSLVVVDQNGAKAKIREGRFANLSQDVSDQAIRLSRNMEIWSGIGGSGSV